MAPALARLGRSRNALAAEDRWRASSDNLAESAATTGAWAAAHLVVKPEAHEATCRERKLAHLVPAAALMKPRPLAGSADWKAHHFVGNLGFGVALEIEALALLLELKRFPVDVQLRNYVLPRLPFSARALAAIA